jgi:rare lipoprotein A (peptidoglycan hydrolase)
MPRKRKLILAGLIVALGVAVTTTHNSKQEQEIRNLKEQVDNQREMLYNKNMELEDLNVKLKESTKVINDLELAKQNLEQRVRESEAQQVSRGGGRQIPVRVTHYSAEETGSSITASGEVGQPYFTLAYNGLPLGTHVRIDGREYVIMDRCGIDGTADIFVNSTAEALSLGAYDTVMEVLD